MEEEAKLVRQSDSIGGGPYINALMHDGINEPQI